MRWLLVGIMIFVNLIMACTLRLAGTPNKNVLLENTLSPAHQKDPQVVALAKEYKKRLMQIAAVLSLICLTLLLPGYESIMMTLFWLILFLSMGGGYLCEIIYIRKMHRLIVENHWQLPVEPIIVDTKLVLEKNQKILSPWWLLPSLLLGIAGTIYQLTNQNFDGGWIMILVAAFFWLFSAYIWYVIYRLPVRAITGNETVNRQYNDLTKHDWSFLTIFMSITLMAILFLPLFSLQATGTQAYIWLTLLFGLIMFFLAFTIGYLLRLRKKQDALISQVPDFRYLGEDQYWRYGVYINPHDTRLMVPDRIGTNISFNLGRPAGKVIMGLTGIILLVAMVITLVPMYLYDFTGDPFELTDQKNTVILAAPFAPTSRIEKDQIESVNLIEKMPADTVRTNGLGSENYSVGHFSVAGKKANVYLDHRSKPILKIETKTRDYYYTNKDPQKTRAAYQRLEK